MISNSVNGPRLTLTAAHAMMGDAVPHTEDGQLQMRVNAHAGAGCWLELHTAAGRVERQPVPEDEFHLDFRAAADSVYVRAQLVDENGQVCAVTNPIYLQ